MLRETAGSIGKRGEVFRVIPDPRYSQGMTDWITDRQPTEAEGDTHGYVVVPRGPDLRDKLLQHWSYVGPGVPWHHCSGWQPPAPVAEPARPATEPRRFVSISRTIVSDEDHILDAIADDGTAWFLRSNVWSRWRPMVSLPEYEVPADA